MKTAKFTILGVGLAALFSTSAHAMPIDKLGAIGADATLVSHRIVCDDYGRCFRRAHRQHYREHHGSHYYAPRYSYGTAYSYGHAPRYSYGPGYGYGYGGGPSIGFSFGGGSRW